ncbi:phage baseplate assembly protein V [Hoeflea sp.]|uniref:phage baseplate assembly protein V n=1 Tax=Hoeflea sp. TaxID=1940281 RepID=UPI003B519F2C
MSQIAVNRAIFARLQEIERRAAGSEWRGKVLEVDTQKALVRVALGKDPDGETVKSPWVPYKQTAGAMKFHNPPSVGQVMTIRSEAGDIEQGLAEPFRWSDENPANSEAPDGHVMTFGEVSVAIASGALVVTVGGTTFSFSGGGFVQTGGVQEHDGKNVGKDHAHESAPSGPPGPPI